MSDRPSVTDNARAEAKRRYPDRADYRTSLGADPEREGKRHAFIAGVLWAAGRAETTTEQKVHNHGPTEGRGLDCPETTLPDGRLRGACLARPRPTREQIAKTIHAVTCGFADCTYGWADERAADAVLALLEGGDDR